MTRDVYLDAAGVALDLLRHPAVADRWRDPSALPGMTVGALAAHLARQVLSADQLTTDGSPAGSPIPVLEHYRRSAWVTAPLDSEPNTSVRDGAEAAAGNGPDAVADATAEALDRLRERIPAEPADRVVGLPWAGWNLTLDDFLLTRTMEIVVHSDDLAVSVGIDTPAMPQAATDAVITLLAAVAAWRHGPYPVIRALSRAERAPETISAF